VCAAAANAERAAEHMFETFIRAFKANKQKDKPEIKHNKKHFYNSVNKRFQSNSNLIAPREFPLLFSVYFFQHHAC
jgi:hypothetical protein